MKNKFMQKVMFAIRKTTINGFNGRKIVLIFI